ncbi:helix-turn-helix domain-containing protein [Fretibacter rubidus]|uniref:helix-turn-helix domain-containing protein n=1 Tax=Fretibacter rubidus TaxID=570162 RepID=UPI00352A4C16
MYDPKGNGIEKSVGSVQFTETRPPQHLKSIVHRYLDIHTENTLLHDYRFHALPDACTYVIFDQRDRRIAGLSKLRATSEELNLGRNFSFVNIRFLPGVWQDHDEAILSGIVDKPYAGKLPLLQINQEMTGLDFAEKQVVLSRFVDTLIENKQVVANPITQKIFENIDDIKTVSNMAHFAQLSPRQLQRKLKTTTGFAPHDFLKVIRLQQTLSGKDISSYADQAHFIHSFRKATGYTPARYTKKFDV